MRKLRFETNRAASWLGILLAAAPFITALVAIATFGTAFFKQFSDRKDQRDKDRRQQTDQREKDRQERFDQQFMTAVSQVGADEEGLQAAGAASLLRLQDSASDVLQREIMIYCAAQLRIGTGPRVGPIIKEVFQASIRRVSNCDPPIRPQSLNLSGADLAGIDLSGVNLRGVSLDLDGANLAGSNLSGADLWKVRATDANLSGSTCSGANLGQAILVRSDLRWANLDGARLASANLREAQLAGTRLRGAKLQSAHLEDSVMTSTLFDRADVNDTYFTRARMDAATLQSLTLAKNRDKAHGLSPAHPPAGPTLPQPEAAAK